MYDKLAADLTLPTNPILEMVGVEDEVEAEQVSAEQWTSQLDVLDTDVLDEFEGGEEEESNLAIVTGTNYLQAFF